MSKFINNLAYEASAGSGKTFMLVVRYLSLMFGGADPAKILALTFTNKAALEMQERIVLTLEELEHRGELEEISKVTQIDKTELLAQRKKLLNLFLNSSVKIMTIDKFFTQILRKFSLYTSLMPDFTTQSSQHEIKLLSRFLKEVHVGGKKELLIDLWIESNKRLENLFVLLEELYTKEKELQHLRFSKEKSFPYEQEALSALEELRTIVHSSKDASKTAKSSVDVNSFEQLLEKTWITRESLDYRTFSKCYTPQMDHLLLKIQEAILKAHRAKEQSFFYSLMELLEIYKKAKKALYQEDGELSFNDVTLLVYYLLQERIDSEFLYFRLDANIEHILLDEFQDTSIVQYEILKPLINEIVSGVGTKEGGSFFFVGDVKQSIYRFRGGVSALFGEVAREQQTKVEPLVTNYRSKKEVVEFVNRVFITKIKNYIPQKTREGADGGYVAVVQSDDLIQSTLFKVKELISMGATLDEIAILCATNGDGEEIKEALHTEGVEVVTETTTKLINQQSIKALLEYLKYLYFKEEIYRHNFFSLIQRDLEPIEFVDFHKDDLFKLIKSAILKYKLFHNEFHLIRFLDALRGYKDIESLLFEYERLEVAAAASDLHGVRVLTIHKSKGLEYEHVIVLDRLKKAPPSRDAIIYEYDGVRLENIYLRIKSRDALDREYKRALEKEKELQIEDSLNALYVAFTRAKENLFIIKKEKDSAFELLELPEVEYGIITCEKKEKIKKEPKKAFIYKELYYGTQSELLNLQKESDEDLDAIHFGLALHYMLEMLQGFHQGAIEDAYSMVLNKYGALLEEKSLTALKQRVQNLLSSEKFLKLIDGVCYKEKALKYKKALYYIDLLVEVESPLKDSLFSERLFRVIDYKSSKNFHNEHVKQIQTYKKAIATITHEKVEGYICYLLEDKIEIVSVV